MFKNIQYRNKLDSDTWCITIEDDDFEEDIKIDTYTHANTYDEVFLITIINVYERRKLNVAANILLYFIKYEVRRMSSINIAINYFMKTHGFKKYKEDIEKYMALL
jgi:hypothetical protein